MRLLVRLLLLYRPYWPWVLLGFVVALATLVANMALMAISGWFITAMALAGAAGISINYFTPAALIRACAIVRTGGRYAERLVTHETTFRLLARLRVWLYDRIEPLPPQVLEPFHSGDLAGRLRTDVDRLETVYLRVVNPVAVALAAVALLLVYLAGHSPRFAIIEGLCLAVAGLVIPVGVGLASARIGRDRVGLGTRLTEAAVDAIQGMGELLAFGAAARHHHLVMALSRGLIGAQVRLSRLAGLSQAATLLASNLALWGVVVLGIPLVRDGSLDRADFVMIAMLSLAGFEAVAPLPAAFQALGAVLESARRIFALVDAPQGPPPGTVTAVPDRCDLILSGVGFRYRSNGPDVLAGFDLPLPQGARVAILGPMGTGKSTLVWLLTGLRRPDCGTITLGGRPLDHYEPEALRRLFAVAPQHASLFTGTIRDNLCLAKPRATEAELWSALATAQLATFVNSLPNGLETYVGEAGLALSGGQARRLAIARALLKDASVLILDEPGEGLDYHTERTLLAAVVAALGDRTLVLITHRPAGLDLVDRIVHMGD